MQVELNEESIKYLVGILFYIVGQVHTIRTLKKQVNGLGSKLRSIEVGQARIEGHLGFQMPLKPEEKK